MGRSRVEHPLYDDVKGRRRSAGTFTSEKVATRAWQRAEIEIAAMWNSMPSRRDSQAKVASDGARWPPSKQAITDCMVPARANWVWVSPFSVR